MLLAGLFTVLFYQKMLGLNLLVYDLVILVVVAKLYKEELSRPVGKALLISFFASGLAVVAFNSVYSKSVNVILSFTLSGYLASGLSKASYFWFVQGIGSAFVNQGMFVRSMTNIKSGLAKYRWLRWIAIGVPVVFVLLVFLSLYYHASPWLKEAMDGFVTSVLTRLGSFLESIRWGLFWVFILGLVLTNMFVQRTKNKIIKGHGPSFELERKKSRRTGVKRSMTALLTEFKSGLVLLVCLNLLLAVVNLLDIKNIWFGFSFEGQFLKELVHQGTYTLIFSVILSMLVVLFYYRGNLNFYRKNNRLKVLTYLWIGQNMLLLVSVLIRNSIYIHYYALAYKRIGVFMFLLATMVALIALIVKVRKTRSLSFFMHANGLSVMGILVVGCFFNWDVWIARYNINHHQTAFLHLDYMAQLSEKAYPEMDLPLSTLQEFKLQEPEYFRGFSSSVSRVVYMDPETFHAALQRDKEAFLAEYSERSWLEWNLADHQAYNRLSKKR